jgi:hypothetical protein
LYFYIPTPFACRIVYHSSRDGHSYFVGVSVSCSKYVTSETRKVTQVTCGTVRLRDHNALLVPEPLCFFLLGIFGRALLASFYCWHLFPTTKFKLSSNQASCPRITFKLFFLQISQTRAISLCRTCNNWMRVCGAQFAANCTMHP